jgi:hypothetical protein
MTLPAGGDDQVVLERPLTTQEPPEAASEVNSAQGLGCLSVGLFHDVAESRQDQVLQEVNVAGIHYCGIDDDSLKFESPGGAHPHRTSTGAAFKHLRRCLLLGLLEILLDLAQR